MCGIVGYVGHRQAAEVVLSGLKKLEYRGYDSAGLAILQPNGKIAISRSVGKLSALNQKLAQQMPEGCMGMGHTRWATHGKPSEENAHPHEASGVVVVHNGIIENYTELKESLSKEGVVFRSDTDTEVLCHLVARYEKQGCNLQQAVQQTLQQVVGAYAIVVMSERCRDQIVVARLASPLVIGRGEGENFVASDIPAILSYTRRIITLDEAEMAVLTKEDVRIYRLNGESLVRAEKQVDWSPAMAEKGGFKHFMWKEIHEQPQAIADTMRGRVNRDNGKITLEVDRLLAEPIEHVLILGMGTSYHAGLVLREYIERLARLSCQVELASEFRYRDPVVLPNTLVVVLTQSGETVDTIAGAKEAKARGARVLAISNVVDSMITRVADDTLYTRAGIEIGVASTKAYVTQLVAGYLLALRLAENQKTQTSEQIKKQVEELAHVPNWVNDIIQRAEMILPMAKLLSHATSCLFLGRGLQVPTAYEGALKLKELSYIHAEGYAAGEMKHGPIALIDENFFVVVIGPKDATYEKLLSNVEQVQARSGRILAIVTDQDKRLADLAEKYFSIPACPPECTPLLTVIPLQILAYHVALLKGYDVDQPRNLAKSVTVE